MYNKEEYLQQGESYESLTSIILEKTIGGTCTPSTKDENLKQHIDLHWLYNNQDITIDVKGPKKFNRWDPGFSDTVWIEAQGITGMPGWIYGSSTYISFWLKDGISFVPTAKLRKLYDNFLKEKHLHVGIKPNEHYELYRRENRSDILFTMPVEHIRKIEEFFIQMDVIKSLGVI